MTRRDIILQILSEATGRQQAEVAELFESMLAHELIGGCDLEEEFSPADGCRLLEEFRPELAGIRRWLTETGLLEESGNA
jgi:hypothetical protein